MNRERPQSSREGVWPWWGLGVGVAETSGESTRVVAGLLVGHMSPCALGTEKG